MLCASHFYSLLLCTTAAPTGNNPSFDNNLHILADTESFKQIHNKTMSFINEFYDSLKNHAVEFNQALQKINTMSHNRKRRGLDDVKNNIDEFENKVLSINSSDDIINKILDFRKSPLNNYNNAVKFYDIVQHVFPNISNLTIENIVQSDVRKRKEIQRLKFMLVLIFEISHINSVIKNLKIKIQNEENLQNEHKESNSLDEETYYDKLNEKINLFEMMYKQKIQILRNLYNEQKRHYKNQFI